MNLLVDGLATARLARLVSKDRITRSFRDRVSILADDGRLPDAAVDLVGCPWCMAVWIAGAVVVARRTVPTVWAPLARLLAVSMIAGIAAETRIVIEPIHPRFADEQYAPTVRSSQN